MKYRIKELRTKKDMKAKQLAEMAGISQPFLSQLEGGLREPSTETLDAIAAALNVPVAALMINHDDDAKQSKAFDELDTLDQHDRDLVYALIHSLASKRPTRR